MAQDSCTQVYPNGSARAVWELSGRFTYWVAGMGTGGRLAEAPGWGGVLGQTRPAAQCSRHPLKVQYLRLCR